MFKEAEVIGDKSIIYVTELTDVKELNKKLVEYICSFEQYKDENVNPYSFQTPWLISSAETKYIVKKVFDMLGILGLKEKFIAYNVFGNIYKTGDRNKIHNHPSAEYSFNYYVQIPENSAPTRFVASDKSIPAKEGRLTLFAGHLKHEVPPSNHQGLRITLAGNLRREKV